MLMYIVPSMMGAAQLGQVAFMYSVAYNLLPISAIPMFPPMQIGLWKIAIFGLWMVYGGFADDEALFASNLIGFLAGIFEVGFRCWMLLPYSLR
ncbi:hypothetical protein MTO96_033650 [Rhipicephalus appendiculatus]